jgi:hypothetical protein
LARGFLKNFWSPEGRDYPVKGRSWQEALGFLEPVTLQKDYKMMELIKDLSRQKLHPYKYLTGELHF